ncbi:uncharacterized protein LOC108602878 [Drosophila busckii]|uniref:uncharacterized protein LOC108602878 n=1 Tax=Drosophila busckii TaxID=30019 RepID=UPI00083F1718|nr:uncharacterized protein LOC108602878 [Drosophila busckii]
MNLNIAINYVIVNATKMSCHCQDKYKRHLLYEDKQQTLLQQWTHNLSDITQPHQHARRIFRQLLQHQLNVHGYLSEPFINPSNLNCNMEELLFQTKNVPAVLPDIEIYDAESSDTQSMELHRELKSEQLNLKRQLNTLQLHLTTLQIECKHLEQQLEKMQQQKEQKQEFSQQVKIMVLQSSEQAISAQKPGEFPHRFMTKIFALFNEDETFKAHCQDIDGELAKLMHKLCVQANDAHEQASKLVRRKKLKDLRAKLIKKYENKVAKREQSQQQHVLALRQKCFQLLQDFLTQRCSNQEYLKSYFVDLSALYEEESEKL